MKTMEKMCYLLATANILRPLFGSVGNWLTEYNQFNRHHIKMTEVLKSVIPGFIFIAPIVYIIVTMIYLGLH